MWSFFKSYFIFLVVFPERFENFPKSVIKSNKGRVINAKVVRPLSIETNLIKKIVSCMGIEKSSRKSYKFKSFESVSNFYLTLILIWTEWREKKLSEHTHTPMCRAYCNKDL